MINSMYIVSATKKGLLMVRTNALNEPIESVFIPFKEIKSFKVKKGFLRIVIDIFTKKSEKPLTMRFNTFILPIKKQKQNTEQIIKLLESNALKRD